MKFRYWIVGIRSLMTIGRELRDIKVQLTRLANAAEGIPAAKPNPPEEFDAPSIALPNSREFASAYEIEQRLRRTLGRDPDPDEIIRELDGVEA